MAAILAALLAQNISTLPYGKIVPLMFKFHSRSPRWLVRTLIPVLGDLGILFCVLTVSIVLRDVGQMHTGLIPAFMPLFALFLGIFYAAGLYELRQVRDFVSLIGGLLVSAGICGALGTFYFYIFAPYFAQTPKTYLFLVVTLSHLAMLGWRRTILLVTDFSLMRLRLLVLASEDHMAHLRQGQALGSSEGLDLALTLGPDVDLVVADSAWIEEHWDQAKRVFSAAVEQKVSIVSLNRFYESMFGKVSPLDASDPSWALENILPRADGLYFKARRVFDFTVAALGLLVLSPLLLLTAGLIRLVDGTAPVYGQQRVGYLGRVFTLWKFRTMRQDADAAGPFLQRKEGVDGRVTPMGRVLRRFRIDEILQLWNVLRGEMSLVGPRPEWVREVMILEKLVPNYHLRHLVPPGITGWAQVYFRATNDPQDSIEKHHYDLYYLKHFSPALDLSILLKTAMRVFVHDQGIESARTPFARSAPRIAPTLVDMASIISRN